MENTRLDQKSKLSDDARGFVLKSDAGRDLVSAVEALERNRMFFSNSSSDICTGTFQNWDGQFMSVSTIKRTVDPTIMSLRVATIERVYWISFGIFRTTFGPPWGLLHTPTLKLEAT
jgi:hypothetical protein